MLPCVIRITVTLKPNLRQRTHDLLILHHRDISCHMCSSFSAISEFGVRIM